MRTPAVLGFIVAAAVQLGVAADAITIEGQRLDQVLVTKTSSFYYVQIPAEGRTLSIPVENVDAGSVHISDDPFYRDDLQAEYKANQQRRQNDEPVEVEPAFRAGSDSLSAPVIVISRTEVEQALASMGLRFTPGPTYEGKPSVVADMNGVRIQLLGPPEWLLGMISSATGSPQQIEMLIAQQRMMGSQLAPGFPEVMNAAVNEAKETGYSKKDLGDGYLEITYKKDGDVVAYEYKVTLG